MKNSKPIRVFQDTRKVMPVGEALSICTLIGELLQQINEMDQRTIVASLGAKAKELQDGDFHTAALLLNQVAAQLKIEDSID